MNVCFLNATTFSELYHNPKGENNCIYTWLEYVSKWFLFNRD